MHWYYWAGIVAVCCYLAVVVAVRWIDRDTEKEIRNAQGRKEYERIRGL